MEKKIESENGSQLVFTSKEKVDENTNFGEPMISCCQARDSDGVVSIGRPVTSVELNSRLLWVKFEDKEHSEFGNDDNVKTERNFPAMNETERKFIIMSRIAVALRRKGLYPSVSIHHGGYYCNIYVTKHDGDVCESVADVSSDATEAELLEWWSAIENGVE